MRRVLWIATALAFAATFAALCVSALTMGPGLASERFGALGAVCLGATVSLWMAAFVAEVMSA